jgi:hypothetical protein
MGNKKPARMTTGGLQWTIGKGEVLVENSSPLARWRRHAAVTRSVAFTGRMPAGASRDKSD